MDKPSALASVTGLVLAGGRGTRMGGLDKGLQTFGTVALAEHALARLQAQQGGPLGGLLLNANRNLPNYAAIGAAYAASVVADTVPDFAGPLAGVLAGLAQCRTRYLLTVPCDSPLFPADLASRLLQRLQTQHADIAMVAAPETNEQGRSELRPQPVFCLLSAHLRDALHAFMQQGGRKFSAWTNAHATVLEPFNQPGDAPLAFANANTLAELRDLPIQCAIP